MTGCGQLQQLSSDVIQRVKQLVTRTAAGRTQQVGQETAGHQDSGRQDSAGGSGDSWSPGQRPAGLSRWVRGQLVTRTAAGRTQQVGQGTAGHQGSGRQDSAGGSEDSWSPGQRPAGLSRWVRGQLVTRTAAGRTQQVGQGTAGHQGSGRQDSAGGSEERVAYSWLSYVLTDESLHH